MENKVVGRIIEEESIIFTKLAVNRFVRYFPKSAIIFSFRFPVRDDRTNEDEKPIA